MKKTLILTAIIGLANAASSQAAVIFTGFDADSEQFSFFSDTDISSGTQLFFTDDEWNGTAFVDNNEGTMSLTLTATLSAGTSVVVDGPTDSVTGASGTLLEDDSSFNLSGSGDSIYVFTGSRGTPTFLGFLTTGGDTSPGTGVSIDATSLSGTDVFAYTGPTSGETDFASYITLVQDVATNWTAQGDGTGSQSASFAPPSNFTVVPEPSAALLGAFGMLALLRRRR